MTVEGEYTRRTRLGRLKTVKAEAHILRVEDDRLWCPHCLKPSAIRSVFAITATRNLRLMAHWTIVTCNDCRQILDADLKPA